MPQIHVHSDSIFARRRRLYTMIGGGELGTAVLDQLLPNGQPHIEEDSLWDYKYVLPVQEPGKKISDKEKENLQSRFAEIVKDAVSFYNSYGGYIVAGITDTDKSVTGFTLPFSCEELNKKILGATGHSIECKYRQHSISIDRDNKTVGLLYIPQRPDETTPVQFIRNAPKTDTGKQSYKKGDIYFRQRDECRSAENSEELAFLFTRGRRQFVEPMVVGFDAVLDNSLPPRDPFLIRFIGREEYIRHLWRWLLDRYNPVKLLAGLGGVGKTSIARAFAEELTRNAPSGIEKIVWLSAKRKTYAAVLGKLVLTTRVDFSDTYSMMCALLLELGYKESDIDPEWTREELTDSLLEALMIFPCVLFVDDVDTLPAEQQQDLFHTVIGIMGRTANAPVPSRALLTARLDLGAAPNQLIRVRGLEYKEFVEYVEMTSESLETSLAFDRNSALMKRFHKVSGGSPVFAASMLRLVSLGEDIHIALKSWQGAEGEEARKYAFGKELDCLTDSQIRTLFAASQLAETSFVELINVTMSNETLMRDNIAALRQYHLISTETDISRAGVRLAVPSGIRLMNSMMRSRIHDPSRIEKACAQAQNNTAKMGADASPVISEVVAYWHQGEPELALEIAEGQAKKFSENGDFQCLLGRGYLRIEPPDGKKADIAFRRAYDLGCQRAELAMLWIEAKQISGDWVGVIEVSGYADRIAASADNVVSRAEAYRELAQIAVGNGNLLVASERLKEGGKTISHAFAKGRARGRVEDLKELQRWLFAERVRVLDQLIQDPGDHIDVWLASMDAFDNYTRQLAIIELGVSRLASWWRSVQMRDNYEIRSANLMEVQLQKLDTVLYWLRSLENPPENLINRVVETRDALDASWARYREQC